MLRDTEETIQGPVRVIVPVKIKESCPLDGS
jgi:hypothetical protein